MPFLCLVIIEIFVFFTKRINKKHFFISILIHEIFYFSNYFVFHNTASLVLVNSYLLAIKYKANFTRNILWHRADIMPTKKAPTWKGGGMRWVQNLHLVFFILRSIYITCYGNNMKQLMLNICERLLTIFAPLAQEKTLIIAIGQQDAKI